jgi:release factor glutamine methyltransferase
MSVSLAAALDRARQLGVDRLDAQRLLAHHLGRSRTWVIAHDDETLPDGERAAFDADCDRRATGVPLAYLTGRREFHGIDLVVSPAVLIPRPDTEVLVDWALALLAGPLARLAEPRVVDLGTGSGAIAIAVARACPRARLTATDRSADALAVARRNADRFGVAVDFRCGDWWAAVAGQRFDLAISNPPYIADGDPHLLALRHEPPAALTSGSDGLGALRTICGGAAAHLEPQGWLIVEHGHDQAMAVAGLLGGAGLVDAGQRLDIAGHHRCAGARRAAGGVVPITAVAASPR